MAKLNLDKFKSSANSALEKQKTQGIFKEHHDTHESVDIDKLVSGIKITLLEDNIDALRHSIETLGQIEPIIVRNIGEQYEVLNGNRRVEVAKKLGFADISADIIEVSDEDALFLPYLLNSHKGFDVIELGQYLKTLKEVHNIDDETVLKKTGLNVKEYDDLFYKNEGDALQDFNAHYDALLKKYFKMKNGNLDIEKSGIRLKIIMDSAKADDETKAELYRFIHKLSNL